MKAILAIRFSSVVLVGSLAIASAASAAGPEVDAQFRAMDTNKDRKLSPNEHAAGAKQMFTTMDVNKDGKVTAVEMEAAHQQVSGKRASKTDIGPVEKIKVIDTDGDGILSAEEHEAGSRAMFEAMDTNKDGFLKKTELAAGHARMLTKKPSR